jgi:hypothetical protein
MRTWIRGVPALGPVRRLGGRVRRRFTRRSLGKDPQRCGVCGGAKTSFEAVRFAANPRLVRRFARCRRCGFLQIEELTQDRYQGKASLDDLPEVGHGRIGTSDEPGREFKMTRLALDILDRDQVDVLLYGIGRSLDNHHVAALPRVRDVAIGDIVKLRDDAEFHDATQRATRRFPVVVASEVVEHFREPQRDFARLFEFVSRDGLLICATNIYRGGDLAEDRYPFWPDHTSYYTGRALLEIARTNGYLVDFRTPRVTGENGRKRYVFFTRSPQVLQAVALHFASVTLGPSEPMPPQS